MGKLNVLLISKRTEQALELHDRLKANPTYEVQFEETAEAAMALILKGKLNSIVFNIERFGAVQEKLVFDVRELANITQIVVISGSADPESMARIKTVKGLVVVDKSNLDMESDLLGLCERLIGSESLYFRESVRKKTNQPVKVEVMETKRHYDGVMKDITAKGACIELNTTTLKAHDKIKISIFLQKLNRQRSMLGEVRWAKSKGGKGTVGVKFLTDGSEDTN